MIWRLSMPRSMRRNEMNYFEPQRGDAISSDLTIKEVCRESGQLKLSNDQWCDRASLANYRPFVTIGVADSAFVKVTHSIAGRELKTFKCSPNDKQKLYDPFIEQGYDVLDENGSYSSQKWKALIEEACWDLYCGYKTDAGQIVLGLFVE